MFTLHRTVILQHLPSTSALLLYKTCGILKTRKIKGKNLASVFSRTCRGRGVSPSPAIVNARNPVPHVVGPVPNSPDPGCISTLWRDNTRVERIEKLPRVLLRRTVNETMRPKALVARPPVRHASRAEAKWGLKSPPIAISTPCPPLFVQTSLYDA